MQAARIVSQPNYLYEAVQQSGAEGGEQYVASRLRLAEVPKVATALASWSR